MDLFLGESENFCQSLMLVASKNCQRRQAKHLNRAHNYYNRRFNSQSTLKFIVANLLPNMEITFPADFTGNCDRCIFF